MNKNEQFEVTIRNAISQWLALEAEGNPLALNYCKQYRKMIDPGQVSTATIIKSISTILDKE
ncbi:MAG TPA: hypothetical protein VH186_28465 [Chloroflexia bacterium]|nr:hypothetical protein [Chloroflexia bacterium]